MPDDQSAPDRHWSYPEPIEPKESSFWLFWAAFLLLIAAWQAFEHSSWISTAVFLWAGVASLWSFHKAGEKYEIAKLQFELAEYQHRLSFVQESIIKWDLTCKDKEIFENDASDYRQTIQDLEQQIDAIKAQTKWHNRVEFLWFCLLMGFFVLCVWSIDRWWFEGSSLKSRLYGKINSDVNYLGSVIPWLWILTFAFLGLVLYPIYKTLAETIKLVKQRAWRKLIDEQGDIYVFAVGGVVGYFLFRWVWGYDYPWFGLSQFGVPLPLAGGIGAAALFIGIKEFIGDDWLPAFAPSPKREPEEDDPLPIGPDATSLEGLQAEDVGSNDPATQEAKHDTEPKRVIGSDGRRNSWGTNVEVRLMVMARTIAIWIFGLLASAIIGGLVGSRLEPTYSDGWGFWGVLAGMLTFACLRLWLAAPSKTKIDPP
jgi:hypothetical protein